MKNRRQVRMSGTHNMRIRLILFIYISIVFGIGVSAVVPRTTIYFLDLVIVILSFAIPSFCVFFLLTRNIIRYVFKLTAGLGIIAQGNLNYRIMELRKDELGGIASNINSMAEKLETQINRERQLEQAKLELITGVSHDLRTPLTSIIGYLDLLKDKAYLDQEEHDRFIGNTYNKALQIKLLIDDLFEYTRLTTHELQLQTTTVDLGEMLRQLLVEMEPIAKENQVHLEANLPTTPLLTEIDPDMIKRAIDNLLINALKFSLKPGVIQVSLRLQKDTARICVENDGDPITEEQQRQLFERFYKAGHSQSLDHIPAGAGLGLSIARSIANLHHGELECEHSGGHFTFQLSLLQGAIPPNKP
ncbi:histidine kinase [Paenibacillus riograndensis]|uniref:histidine kinase n=2 Tax=Paenibacillus riograndensis TaxID=483937 RepID=A0A132TI86_9BACL|nr:histidine kinase [Paenibacillus riograndensis]